MNIRLLSATAALVTILTIAAPIAFAEDDAAADNTVDVSKQLERIENRLIALERMVLGESKVSGSTMLADHEGRIQAIEAESSKVYGIAEEVGNAVEVLANKVDLISKDIDLRLQDLEKAAADGSFAPKAASTTPAAEKKTESKPVATKAESVADVPANISADELYKNAYGYMKKASFPTAQAWFEAFIQRFPNDDKTQNAYYWLGEVHLVQKQPQDALVAFGQAVKGFPNGDRTADSLLKMGVAFQDIGKDSLARTTWEKLVRDFPDSGAASSAKKRLEGLN